MLALKHLSTAAMLAYGRTLLDPGGLRPLLESKPTTAAMLTRLEALAKELGSVAEQTQEPPIQALKTLRQNQESVDELHDRKARGTFLVLCGLAELEDDEDVCEEYEALRKKLFPKDLTVVNLSYIDEANHADSLEKLLATDPHLAAVLQDITLPHGRTAWTGVSEWIKSGKLLGQLENDRNALLAQHNQNSDVGAATSLRGELLRLRGEWIRVIKAVLANAEIEDFSSDERARLVAPLEQAIAEVES